MNLFLVIVLLPFPIIIFGLTWVWFVKYPKQWRKILPIYIYSIWVLGYCLIPSYRNDMTRYFEILDRIKYLNLRDAILLMNDGLYLENIIFWLVSKIGMYHILPANSCAIVYGVGAYIICSEAEKSGELKNIWLSLLIEFAMLPLFSIANNIRNVAAFGLIVFAAYRDMHERKRNAFTYALYLLPIFLHKTGLVLVALRLLVPLFKRVKVLAVALVIGLPTIIGYANQHLNYFSTGNPITRLLRTLIHSSYAYMLGGTDYAESVKNSLGETVIRITVLFFLLVCVITYLYDKKSIIRHEEKNSNIQDYSFLISIMTFACNLFDAPAYWRFAVAAIIAGGPILNKISNKHLRSVLLGNSVFVFGIAIAAFRLFLSVEYMRTRISFAQYGEDLILTNIYSIAVELLRNTF